MCFKTSSTVKLIKLSVAASFALMSFPSALLAAPHLHCRIDQGGIEHTLDVVATRDPYHFEILKIKDIFRFKAMVFGDSQHVEYVKIYVYAENKRQPLLLHQTTYVAPVVSASTDYFALTGKNFVYSPELERELQYGCVMVEVKE